MLSFVRKHADSWLIKSILWMIVFAFIGTIFYSWGMGGASASRGGVVATVNGSPITFAEYDQTFNNLMNFYRDQFRNQFSEELIKRLDLKTQALDALVQKKLLLDQAKKQNLQISDAELISRIKSYQAFQKDKTFDESLYKTYLKNNRLTVLEFEESQREGLIIEKVEGLIKANTKVSETEITEAYNRENEKIKLDYIVFPDDHFKNSEPVTEQELKDYFEKHKIQFEIPEQIKVEYVKLEPQSFAAEITPQEDDIQNYYETKMAEFHVKKQYKARHILFKLESVDATENKGVEETQKAMEEATKTKAAEVLKQIRGGASFADMAKKYSDDKNSGQSGGSLGEFPAGSMVQEFESALDKLNIGEISEPVLSPYGYHIIQLDGKSDERIKPLSEVKDEIIQKLKESKAHQRVRRVAKLIHKSAEVDSDLERAAKENNFATKKTGLFSRENHEIPEIGAVPDFFNQAFKLEDNRVGEPIQTAEASYIIKVVERNLAYTPELGDVKAQVMQAAEREKHFTATQKKFEELKRQIAEKGLDAIAKELKLDVRHTPYFSAKDSIPGIGNVKSVKDTAFGLKKGESAGVDFRGKNYLIVVQDRELPGTPGADDLRPLTAKIKADKASIIFSDWLNGLKENSDIKIDKTLL